MSSHSFPPRAAFDVGARIGIIGAGAAGLSAARALLRKGFRNVTVLEREGRVGGKCHTFLLDGRTYELGALAVTASYSNIRALLKEFGIKESANEGLLLRRGGVRRSMLFPPLLLDVDPRGPTLVPPVLREHSWSRVAASCARLARETLRYPGLHEPGFQRIPRELTVPFAEWARERNVMEAARLLVEIVFTSFGYGYLAEVPAAYVLKYLPIVVPPLSELLEIGYQGLWETVARGMDVRLGVNVRRVQRGEQVVVEMDDDRLTFDALILALPLDQALPFLDATPEESALAAKILYSELRVVFVSATGLPDYRYFMLPNNFDPATRGEVIIVHKRWKETNVYGFYAYGREGASMDDTIGRVTETVRKLGGKLTHVHRTHSWRYSPRVSGQDLALGFFDRFEAMQGVRRTYHVGELLSLGLIEPIMRHAQHIVDRHFTIARDSDTRR